MPKIGPYSSAATLQKLDGRSREARLMKSLRAELIAHVGGGKTPTITQRILIDQACQLQLRIALMDKDGSGGGLTERNQVQYLSWCGNLQRVLRDLGLDPAPPPVDTRKPWERVALREAAE